ncbi:hypothetical protein E2C01_101982 [Portunus trituberculatus]|uniref:Uncharacterized protein n=1 Tax=Portunus trituberculatus TaxID=210409 RepID=A0A5B7KLP2_PORTR|nr:hypothetical protein [Portunus trituberculatus]
MPAGNTGKVLRVEVGDSPRVCQLSPSRQQNWLFVPLSKRGGPELGSAVKLPGTAGPHDVAGDERKLPVSLSPLQCVLRSTKERDA